MLRSSAATGSRGWPKERESSWVRTALRQYARTVAGDQRIDPRDAAFFVRADFYEVLARLRLEDPVHECGPGFWAVTRYEDIRDLSRDPHHFCSGRGALVNDPLRTTGPGMSAPSILHMDPPQHAAFRGLVNRRFTPRALAGLGESIRTCAAGLLDRGRARATRSTSWRSWLHPSRSP